MLKWCPQVPKSSAALGFGFKFLNSGERLRTIIALLLSLPKTSDYHHLNGKICSILRFYLPGQKLDFDNTITKETVKHEPAANVSKYSGKSKEKTKNIPVGLPEQEQGVKKKRRRKARRRIKTETRQSLNITMTI